MGNPSKALLVVDMQGDYIGDSSKYHIYPESLVDTVNERITKAALDQEIVIYIRNQGRKNKQPYVCPFVDNLAIVSDYFVEKERASVFDNPTFSKILKENKIKHLEVIGIDGNCCVAASAIDAANAGYSVIYPLTYIGFKSQERFKRTKEKLLKAKVTII